MSRTQSIRVSHYGEARPSVADFLGKHSASGEVLFVAGVKNAADDVVRTLSLSGVHRLTLRQLAQAVAQPRLAAHGVSMASGLALQAVGTRIVYESADKLKYFGPVCRMPGFVRALLRTLGELRMARVQADELQGAPGLDLAVLLKSYEAALVEHRLADEASLFEHAATAAGTAAHRYLDIPAVWWHVASRTAAEQRFAEAVRRRSPALLDVDLDASTTEPGNSLTSIRRYLFSGATPPKRTSDESFAIFSASDASLECVEIARRIHRLGFRFDEIAVLLRDARRYEPLVDEAFRRAGIDTFFAQGSSKPLTSGRAFLALLACASERGSAARFAEYLSLERPQSAAWERLIVRASASGNAERWARRLDGLKEQLQEEKQIERLHALSAFCLPILRMLDSLPKPARWGEWIDRLRPLAESALEDPEAVLETLEELELMRDAGPVGLHDVLALLGERLTELRKQPDVKRYGRVWAGSIEAAVGMSFRAVFLPGVAEGIFPRRASEDPLLLDDFRTLAGASLARKKDRAEAENDLLRIAAACASEKLVASYPRMDTFEARRRVPSLYTFELLRAAEGWLPGELADFEARDTAQATLSWPAPADTAVAIDDAEYDLATLRVVRDLSSESKGAAQYLTQINGHLVRSLRTRARRWRRKWFAADGVIDDIEAQILLEKFRPTKHAYAPSALQHFSECPYRFYLRSIMAIRPADKPELVERMDPLVRGQIFHDTQFALLNALESSDALPIRPSNLRKALETLDSCLARVASEQFEKTSPELQGVWRTDVEEIRADLHGWLSDVAEHDGQWKPLRFELSFGRTGRAMKDARSSEEPVTILDGFKLSGAIDLVEAHLASDVLRITDHKSGKPPDPPPKLLGGGKVLQPVLYGLAAEQLLGQRVIGGRLYYTSRNQNYARIDVALNDFARERAKYALGLIDEAIRTGSVASAPDKDACRWCDYRVVCGPHEEDRVAHKPADGLKLLRQLRRID